MAISRSGKTYNEEDLNKQAEELVKKFTKFSVDLDSTLLVALDAAGILVETQAALLAPYDTGLLRKSITHRVVRRLTRTSAEVGTSNEYAPYQEFGTVKMEKQPFLTPALNQEAPRVEAIIRNSVKGAIDRV